MNAPLHPHRNIIVEDCLAHRERLLAQGFWALIVYRLGHVRFKFSSKIVRGLIKLIHIVLSKMCEILFGISIHSCAEIGRNVQIEHFGNIIIHGKAVIGDGCIIRQGVTIGNKNIDKPLDAPVLGSNVNIGSGAKLLGKIVIGNGATIGANAVVIKDVPEGAVAVGVPAEIKGLQE